VPELSGEIRARAMQADRLLRAKGWHIASGLFKSPTFGGGSWLAHSSFLAGVAVSQNRDYELLLSGERDTFVGSFRRAGYRTVALMPGLKLAWPAATSRLRPDLTRALGYAAPHAGGGRLRSVYARRHGTRLQHRPCAAVRGFPVAVIRPLRRCRHPVGLVARSGSAAYAEISWACQTLGDWKARRSCRAAMVIIAVVEASSRAPTVSCPGVAIISRRASSADQGEAGWCVMSFPAMKSASRISKRVRRTARAVGGSLGDFSVTILPRLKCYRRATSFWRNGFDPLLSDLKRRVAPDPA
jgi:hypothetical protein